MAAGESQPQDNNQFQLTGCPGSISAVQPPPDRGNLAAIYVRIYPATGGCSVRPDMYTRVVAYLTLDKLNQPFPYRRNGLLDRFLGKTFSLAESAKVTVGQYVVTIPLMVVSHDSSYKKGEIFQRTFTLENHTLPLFLLRADGNSDAAGVVLQTRLTKGPQSTIASDVTQISSQVLNIALPSSGVVTALNQEKVKDAASAIDQAINAFFGTRITETQIHDLRLQSGEAIAFTLYADVGNAKTDPEPFANGVIAFAPARLSIFDPTTVCFPKAGETVTKDTGCDYRFDGEKGCAINDISPTCQGDAFALPRKHVIESVRPHIAATLEFKLLDANQSFGTVASYLRSQSWWEPGVEAISADPSKAAAGQIANAAKDFCAHVRASIAAVNLSTLDADLIAEAIGSSDLVKPDAAAAVKANCPAS